MLHLNINSILATGKLEIVKAILDSKIVDLLVLQEAKIGSATPDALLNHSGFTTIRRERKHGGGGILVYLRSCYSITALNISQIKEVKAKAKSKTIKEFESIAITIRARNRMVNIVTCYNPHTADTVEFIPRLDRLLSSLNLQFPSFLVGDLNNNMLTSAGDKLRSFLLSHNLVQLVEEPTHFQRGAATLLDVIFTNLPSIVHNESVIDCPDSNQSFVSASFNIQSEVCNAPSIRARVINNENLLEIKSRISCSAFESVLDLFETAHDKWLAIKSLLLEIVDSVCPYKTFRLKKKNTVPWMDKELLYLMKKRDLLHSAAVKSKTSRVDSPFWDNFRQARNAYKSATRRKMKEFLVTKLLHSSVLQRNFGRFTNL